MLHILGIPIPDNMDGKVLKDIFVPDSELAEREVNLVKTEDETAGDRPDGVLDDEVMKRLRDLGYL